MADLFTKTCCVYCQEEINSVIVQCCECPDFDICLQCFASGAEIGPHKNNHSYKLVYYSGVRLFGGRGNWTGQEELLLLDAVELYGFGSWQLVAQHVETRSAEEVKDEYIARYLDGNIGKATWSEFSKNRPVLIDHVPEDTGPLSPAAMSRLPPLDVTAEEARLLDFKPQRDDFEREFDMDAEQLVSKLQLDINEETDMEIALKLAMVDMYTRRLRERARRKRVVRDYQLVAKFFASVRGENPALMLSPEENELRDKMRVFAQFLSSGEHERLIASIERERELRHRLEELKRYHSCGLTTQEEVIHFEQHVTFQEQQQNLKKSKTSKILMQKRLGHKYSVNRSRLYQFAFHLGQQWRCANSTIGLPAIKKRRRGRTKFHRKKIHVVRRKFGQLGNKQCEQFDFDDVDMDESQAEP